MRMGHTGPLDGTVRASAAYKNPSFVRSPLWLARICIPCWRGRAQKQGVREHVRLRDVHSVLLVKNGVFFGMVLNTSILVCNEHSTQVYVFA